jgi:hypothetical protein
LRPCASAAQKGADTLARLADTAGNNDYETGDCIVKRKFGKPGEQANDATLARDLSDASRGVLSLGD